MAFILALRRVDAAIDRPLSEAESEALQVAADQLEAHRVTTAECELALVRRRRGMTSGNDLWALSVWEAAEEAAQLMLESLNVTGHYKLCIEQHSELRLA